MFPKNPKSGREQEFQAKTRKCTNCTISETAHPFKPKFEDIAATIKCTSWVVYHYPIANLKWLAAAILKITMTS